jgi:hypothetical protein
VQHTDGVVRADAEKNEEENTPAGTEALVSEEYAVKEVRPRSDLTSGEDVIE